MAVKVRYSDQPFGDSAKLHAKEMRHVQKVTAAGIQVAFGLIALVLALGALLVVFGANISADNPLVKAVWNVDGWFEGPFSRDGGVFTFHGANAAKLNACANWGLAAVIYLLIGGFLRRWLRRS